MATVEFARALAEYVETTDFGECLPPRQKVASLIRDARPEAITLAISLARVAAAPHGRMLLSDDGSMQIQAPGEVPGLLEVHYLIRDLERLQTMVMADETRTHAQGGEPPDS